MWGNALKSKLALRFQIPSQASLQGIAKNSSPNRTDDGPAEAAEQPKTDSGLLRTEWLVAYHGSLEYPEDSKGERGLMAKWVETCSMFRYSACLRLSAFATGVLSFYCFENSLNQ
jgi:hypothetical protein